MDQVAEYEAVAGDDIAGFDRDRRAKHRAGAGESVELAVLGAWVDVRRQVGQQVEVETAAGEARGQLARVDAGDIGLESAGDHLARQLPRVDAPQREQRRDAGAGELGLAIAADVLEEQVAEGHRLDAGGGLLGDERAHDALVVGVGAGMGDLQHVQRQAGGLGLCLQQRPAHAVHGHPVEGGVDGCEEPDHGHVRPLAQHMQRPGRVLAGAPAQKGSHGPDASWRLTAEGCTANARPLHHRDGRSHGE